LEETCFDRGGGCGMKIEAVMVELDKSNFYPMDFGEEEELAQKNIEVWGNHNKVVFLKEYRSKTSFNKWFLEDQPLIASIYNTVPVKKRNNLYFLLILNFEDYTEDYDDDDLHLKINKAQKDEYVCKKYVLINENDFEKIPFLNIDFTKGLSINYDQDFRDTLFDPEVVEAVAKEKNHDINDFYLLAGKLIDYYFQEFDEDKSNENIFREKITEIRERG
jgi:hypothetical protein